MVDWEQCFRVEFCVYLCFVRFESGNDIFFALLNYKWPFPTIILQRHFRPLVISFGLQYETVHNFLERGCSYFAIIILLVFEIGVNDVLFRLFNAQSSSALPFHGKFSCMGNLLIGVIPKFMIQNIIQKAAREFPCRFATDTRIVTWIAVQNCERQMSLPLSVIFSTCHFNVCLERRMCSFHFPNSLRMFGSCTIQFNSQSLYIFRIIRGSKCCSFVSNKSS